MKKQSRFSSDGKCNCALIDFGPGRASWEATTKTKEEPNMKTFLAVLLTAVLAFAGGHAATISTMEIETDGDCDSAFVTTLGREYFMGANGYKVE